MKIEYKFDCFDVILVIYNSDKYKNEFWVSLIL